MSTVAYPQDMTTDDSQLDWDGLTARALTTTRT